jgi:glycosyltransferase involved in cell wall biosynthesis
MCKAVTSFFKKGNSVSAKNSPLLSVIIPTYNRAHFLPGIIHSLLSQPYINLEIVIVDDGSIDQTAQVVERLQMEPRPKDLSLRYIKQSNRGASAARNHGVQQSRGDYILFADSDDVFLSNGIVAGMAVLDAEVLDYVYLPIRKAEHQTAYLIESPLGSFYDGSDVALLDYHWHTMGVIYRRAFLNHVGGWNETIRTSDDWEYQVRVKLASDMSRFVDVPIGVWNIHNGERLSAAAYNAHYVADVLTVCESIRDHCSRADRLSPTVKSRLFRRLTRHAVEAGAHGDRQLRQQILKVSKPLAIGSLNHAFQSWLEVVPFHSSDWLIYSIVRRVFS